METENEDRIRGQVRTAYAKVANGAGTELEGLTQKDAAEMLDISLSGVKSRVKRGREKIREMFDECCRISVDGRGRVVECEARAPWRGPS